MFRTGKITFIIFFLFMIGNFFFWQKSRYLEKSWSNVPNSPSKSVVQLTFMGNTELAYRFYATMLQNIGSVDGKDISLQKYDYKKLKEWFFLLHNLNPHSDIVPLLAAYYYGGIQDSNRLNEVLDYLEVVGENPDGEKWRWLGHAVFIARHIMKDNERALKLAYKLSENQNPNLADWAKQMPVYVLHDQGDTEIAYKIMLNLLISNIDTLHPNEIFFMQDYICNTLILSDPSLKEPSFCKSIKK